MTGNKTFWRYNTWSCQYFVTTILSRYLLYCTVRYGWHKFVPLLNQVRKNQSVDFVARRVVKSKHHQSLLEDE